MVNVIKLRKGLDIHLQGKAEEKLIQLKSKGLYALVPDDFEGATPKVVVKEGDKVKAGDALFVNKQYPEVKFASPVSGTVREVMRGERRKVLCVKVEADTQQEYVDFGKKDVSAMNGQQVIEALLEAGIFGYINQLPYAVSTNPSVLPRAIFISALRDKPLAADFAFEVKGQETDFQTGLTALSKIAHTYLGCGIYSPFENYKDVDVNVSDAPAEVSVTAIETAHDETAERFILRGANGLPYSFADQQDGSIDLTLREFPNDGETGNYEIRVKDTGIGMSEEFVENLFSPFERERTSTVSKTQGTGLGMAITKNIMDMMGGDILVDTKQNQGTEFTLLFSVPIIEEEAKAVPESSGEERFDGFRALLVEDNASNLEIARAILEQAGFMVETAVNGKQAVDMVAASEAGYFDIILMDVQMPVMNGFEATEAIRSLKNDALSTIPIVAVTANAFQDDMKAAEATGINRHLSKPYDVPKMLSTLADLLQKHA